VKDADLPGAKTVADVSSVHGDLRELPAGDENAGDGAGMECG
jgi:hypothetical protein